MTYDKSRFGREYFSIAQGAAPDYSDLVRLFTYNTLFGTLTLAVFLVMAFLRLERFTAALVFYIFGFFAIISSLFCYLIFNGKDSPRWSKLLALFNSLAFIFLFFWLSTSRITTSRPSDIDSSESQTKQGTLPIVRKKDMD